MTKPLMIHLSPDARSYVIKGELYTRVSEVVDIIPNPWLDRWRKRVGEEEAERISRETSEYGSRLHLTLELHDKEDWIGFDRMLAANPFLVPQWAAWREWTDEYVKEWIGIERVVWSTKYMIAGRIDRIALMRGDRSPSILDLKTGGIYEDTGIPLSLYMMCWNERERRKAKRRMIIKLPRERPGELTVWEPGPHKMKAEDKKAMEALGDYEKLIWRGE